MFWKFIRKVTANHESESTFEQPDNTHSNNVDTEHSPHKNLEEECEFYEATKVTHVTAAMLGFNIIKNENKSYKISKMRLIPTIIFFCSMFYAVGVLCYIVLNHRITFFQFVLMFPTIFNWGSSVYSCIILLKRSPRIIKYLAAIEEAKILIKKPKYVPWIITGMWIYATTFTFCLVLSKRVVPYEFYQYITYPTILSNIMPCFMDIYVFTFSTVIVASLKKLEEHIRRVSTWTDEEITSVAKTWLKIHGLLNSYNEIFSYLLHVRMVVFIILGMTFMYSFSLIKNHMDIITILLTLAALLEVTLRHYVACHIGDTLICTYGTVTDTLREALADGGPQKHMSVGNVFYKPGFTSQEKAFNAEDNLNTGDTCVKIANNNIEGKLAAATEDYGKQAPISTDSKTFSEKVSNGDKLQTNNLNSKPYIQNQDDSEGKMLHCRVNINSIKETDITPDNTNLQGKLSSKCNNEALIAFSENAQCITKSEAKYTKHGNFTNKSFFTDSSTNNSYLISKPGLQNRFIHDLLSRFEAQQMALEVWGFESLSMRTFSSHYGMILTYLVVLLQFG